MAYTIQAIIAQDTVFQMVSVRMTPLIKLPYGYAMLPLTDTLCQRYAIPFLPFTDECILRIPEGLEQLGNMLSEHGRVAYVEAEFFGGDGTQASLLWEHGEVMGELQVAQDAINHALHLLGVVKAPDCDEFETLRLGMHRATEDWIADVEPA
jgi:hypothetical protein